MRASARWASRPSNQPPRMASTTISSQRRSTSPISRANSSGVPRKLIRPTACLSTHDLTPKDGFLLLTDRSGAAWVSAAEAAAEKFGVAIVGVTIGDRGDYADADGVWAQVREISEGGAVIVRPDNHVAFRAAEPVGDARDVVTSTIGALLGR